MTDFLVLGTGTAGGTSVDIVLDEEIPAAGCVQIAWATLSAGEDGDIDSTPLSVTDTRGAMTWVISTDSRAIVGAARDDNSVPLDTNFDSYEIGTVGGACSVAGQLQVGDTITLTFQNVDHPGVFSITAAAVWFRASFAAVPQWYPDHLGSVSPGEVDYATGIGYPNGGSSSPTALSWSDDYPFGTPAPGGAGAAMITVVGGGGDFAGSGTEVVSVEGAPYLSVHTQDATADTGIEPGGNFTGGGDVFVGNFQFMGLMEASGYHILHRF